MAINSKENTWSTFLFICVLCFVSAFLLAFVTTMLRPLQRRAEDLFNYTQLLIAAKILNNQKQCILLNSDKGYKLARFDEKLQQLIPTKDPSQAHASEEVIYTLFKTRIEPVLTDSQGDVFSFEEKNINYLDYLTTHKKKGYAHLPLKLVYTIKSNTPGDQEPYGYIIPINGFGLWDAIYGYLAIQANAIDIIGVTFYEQKETPGLGAEISSSAWQKQFFGKEIVQPMSDGQTNLKKGRLGITVVKSTVKETFGSTPKSKNAVDGMPGATETGKGVTMAFHSSLSPYRAFLIKANQHYKERSQ